MEAFDMLDKAIEEGHRWVSSLDRSRLGRFAVPQRHLVLVHALDDRTMNTGGNHGGRLIATAVRNEITNEMKAKGYDLMVGMVEFDYWKGTSTAFYKYKGEEEVEANRLAYHLSLIESYCETYHDYFAQNIWDIPDIEEFMASGVDPEIAGRLVR